VSPRLALHCSLDGTLPPGGFTLPDPSQVPEVMALGLVLEAVGTLMLTEVAFPPSPSPPPAARPPHTLPRVTAAHTLLSASWAPAIGGLSCRIRASPIRLQASLIPNRHLS